jgi:aspartate aminotransferase-like enzyme
MPLSTATSAGIQALGIEPWIVGDDSASALVTAVPVPAGVEADALIAVAASLGVSLGRGFGEIENRLVRLIHTAAGAQFGPVLANVIAYGVALERLGHPVRLGAAAEAVASAYASIA